MAITKNQTYELNDLLEQFVEDLGESIDSETDQDSIEILRPIYMIAQQLGNAIEPIL